MSIKSLVLATGETEVPKVREPAYMINVSMDNSAISSLTFVTVPGIQVVPAAKLWTNTDGVSNLEASHFCPNIVRGLLGMLLTLDPS